MTKKNTEGKRKGGEAGQELILGKDESESWNDWKSKKISEDRETSHQFHQQPIKMLN